MRCPVLKGHLSRWFYSALLFYSSALFSSLIITIALFITFFLHSLSFFKSPVPVVARVKRYRGPSECPQVRLIVYLSSRLYLSILAIKELDV